MWNNIWNSNKKAATYQVARDLNTQMFVWETLRDWIDAVKRQFEEDTALKPENWGV